MIRADELIVKQILQHAATARGRSLCYDYGAASERLDRVHQLQMATSEGEEHIA